MSDRVLFVGAAPSRDHGRDIAFAGSASAARLELLLGVQPGELLAVADTVNLYPEHPGLQLGGEGDVEPPARELRRAALELDLSPYSRVVFCGTAVARAFGIRAPLLSRISAGGREYLMLPHPSPVSRWWNEHANRAAAARAVAAFAPEVARPVWEVP